MPFFAEYPELRDTATPSELLSVVFKQRSLLFLSPHSDDASYSSDLLIQTCVRMNVPVHIVTVFSRSGYTTDSPLGAVGQTTRMRKAEDRRYTSQIGALARISWLDFNDAPLRAGYEVATTCSGPRFTKEDQVAVEELETFLDAACTTASVLAIPLGLGGHVDHLLTREAAIAVLDRIANPVIFYEDLPYAADLKLEDIGACVAGLAVQSRREFVPVLVPAAGLRPKEEAVALYGSQYDARTTSRIAYHAARFCGPEALAERLWMSWSRAEKGGP